VAGVETFADAAQVALKLVEKQWQAARAIVIWRTADGVEAIERGSSIKLDSLDLDSDDALFEALGQLGSTPAAGSLIVPLLAGGRREGALCALGVSAAAHTLDGDLPEVIATLLGTIRACQLEQERLAEETKNLRHQAHTDPLTGLLNRRGFTIELEHHLQHSQTAAFSDVLLLADVQGLKEANDRHGYAIGDQLLMDIAHALQTMALADDVVGRLGGDEFVVILCGRAASQRASAYAADVRRHLTGFSGQRPLIPAITFAVQELSAVDSTAQAFELAGNPMFERGS